MKKVKKLFAVLVVLGILISSTAISLSVFAENIGNQEEPSAESLYPFEVECKPNKEKYFSFQTATFNVEITNIGESAVSDIITDVELEGLELIGRRSTPSKSVAMLGNKQNISYSFSAIADSQNSNFFMKMLSLIKKMFLGTCTNPEIEAEGRNSVNITKTVQVGSNECSVKITVYYKYDSEILSTNDEMEFSSKVAEMVADNEPDNTGNPDYSSRRIIASFDDMNDTDLSKYNAEVIAVNNNDNTVIMQFSNSDLAENCANMLSTSADVEFVEPDKLVYTQEIEITQEFPQEDSQEMSSAKNTDWGQRKLKTADYCNYLKGNDFSEMLSVAVVDSGADLNHPYYSGRLLSSGYDFVNFDNSPEDENGHGTHVIGIIASSTQNLSSVKIMPVKVFGESGEAPSSIVAIGINYAVNNGADVINLSLGGPISGYIDKAVLRAHQEGVVVCAAAGNESTDVNKISPAHVSEIITVSAINSSSQIAWFSNYGDKVDVCAPGVEIYSSIINGQYGYMSGTSMATPFISACCAMILLENTSYTVSQVEQKLKNSCVDLGTYGRDNFYGTGCPDMYIIIPSVTISFNTYGGTTCTSKTVKSGSRITLPESQKSFTITLNANGGSVSPTKYLRDCQMAGWYENSSLSGLRYEAGDSYLALKNRTLYLAWTLPTRGDVANATRQYYDFNGWFSSASSGVKYTSLSPISSNITLYSQWTRRTTTMPNLIGQSYTSARNLLNQKNIIVNLASRYNYNVNANIVFSQSVSSGTVVNEGSSVTLTYSLGAKPFAVGDLVWYEGQYLYGAVPNLNPRDVSANTNYMYITGFYDYQGQTYVGLRYGDQSTRYGWTHISTISQLTN